MKKLTSIFLITMALFIFESCQKTEDVAPEDQTESNENENSNVNEVDVLGLDQNSVKANGISEEKLKDVWLESYGEGDDLYTKYSFFGANSALVEITVKGSEFKTGNYSLKKWALGSGSSSNEVVVRVAIAGTLLDFETSDSDKFSITKNNEGFYVLKMAPLVGIKKNSWDDDLTEPISLHIVANSKEVAVSEDGVNIENISKYGFSSSISYAQVYYYDDFGPLRDINIAFFEYDFTVAAVGKQTISLSQRPYTLVEVGMGTVPKGIHFTSGWQGKVTHDYSLDQEIEVELTPEYIILNYSDIKMLHKDDPNDTFNISGEIMIAR